MPNVSVQICVPEEVTKGVCLHARRVSFSFSLPVFLSPPLSLTNPQAESTLQGILLICLSIRTTPFFSYSLHFIFPLLYFFSLFLFASIHLYSNSCFSLMHSHPFHSKHCCGLLTIKALHWMCPCITQVCAWVSHTYT